MRRRRPDRPRGSCPGCWELCDAAHDRAACSIAAAERAPPDMRLAELYYGRVDLLELAEAIGVGRLAVLQHLAARAMLPRLLIRTGLDWEPRETARLRTEYPDCDTRMLAASLSRSVKSVLEMAHVLGVRKSSWGLGRRGNLPTETRILVQVGRRPARNRVSFGERIIYNKHKSKEK